MKQMQKSYIPFNKAVIYGFTIAALTAISSGASAAGGVVKTCGFEGYESDTVICGDDTTTVEPLYDGKPAKGVVLGIGAKATGESNVVIGATPSASHTSSVAIGYDSKAHHNQTVAIGHVAEALGEADIMVGKLAGNNNTSKGRNIGLGESALRDATSDNVVAIGTNAGRGMNGTHSVIVGTEANTALGDRSAVNTNYNTAVGYRSYASGGSAFAGGHDAKASGSQAVAIGFGSVGGGSYTVAVGRNSQASNVNGVAIGNGSSSTGISATSVGLLSQATGRDSVAIGTNAQTTGNSGLALGQGSSADQNFGVALGALSTTKNTQIQDGYAPAKISTEAQQSITNTKANTAGVSLGGEVSEDATKPATLGSDNVMRRQIHYLAAGTNDTDAVNVAQLKALEDSFNQQGLTFTGNTGSTTQKLGSSLKIAGDENIVTEATENNIQLKLKKNLDLTANGSVQIGDVKLSHDTVNVGGNKITNVKAGEVSATSTDAVNGSQLHETNVKVATNTANIQQNANKIAKGLTFAGDTGSVNTQLGDTFKLAGSKNITTSVDPATKTATVKLNDVVNVKTVNSDVYNVNGSSVQLGATGLNNGGNTITNVADGVNNSDAVNLGQLNRALKNMPTKADVQDLNGRVNGLNQSVGKMNSRINEVEQDGRAGVAMSMATAGLGQVYVPGRSAISVGTGFYRGEQGYAIGLSSISDGGNWILKGSVSGNSRGHIGGTTSVTYMF